MDEKKPNSEVPEEVNAEVVDAPPSPENPPGKGLAIASLICGIAAMVLPIPFLDLAAGIVGLVLFSRAKKVGFSGGLLTAGLVCSIIGTVWAAVFTACVACFGAAACATIPLAGMYI